MFFNRGAIKGSARMDRMTKKLFSRLKNGDIAIIDHADLDEVAAEGLLKKNIRAVLNTAPFITGHYPNKGPGLLLEKGIMLLELPDDSIFHKVREGERLEIRKAHVYQEGVKVQTGRILTLRAEKEKISLAKEKTSELLDCFVQNTLDYALKEKHLILGGITIPEITTDMLGKHVLVVVRGQNYRQDLRTVLTYVEEKRPVLVGVDGGGDALKEFGFTPDIIIGDMDSVSDRVLQESKEIILHAYTDGEAPGEKKCRDLGIEYKKFSAPGTSEDIALLLAYEKGAELIVALGTHSNMIDFLEKGRPGMASTFLVRLKVGSRLVDARGVSQLYQGQYKGKSLLLLVVAAVVPIILIWSFSPLMQHVLRLMLLRVRLNF